MSNLNSGEILDLLVIFFKLFVINYNFLEYSLIVEHFEELFTEKSWEKFKKDYVGVIRSRTFFF